MPEPEQQPVFWRDWLFWAEILSTGGIGAILFFALDLKDLGQVAWILGALLVYHRYAIGHSTRALLEPLRQDQLAIESSRASTQVAIDEIKASQGEVTKNLAKLSSRFDSLGSYVDLNLAATESAELRTAVDSYFRITEPELDVLKNEAVVSLRNTLDGMRQQKRSRTLYTSEYYGWLLPRLRAAQPDSEIWAISRMLSCEWDDSPEEAEFLELNLAAAKSGVRVDRLFLCTSDIWDEAIQTKPVQDQISCQGLTVYFGDLNAIQRRDAHILSAVGDGLIAFDRRVLLVDEHSEDGSARGHVSVNDAEIARMRQAYDNLRRLCRRI